MAHQPGLLAGSLILICAYGVYLLSDFMDKRSSSFINESKVRQIENRYSDYKNTAEIIKARNILNQLDLRMSELHALQSVCMNDSHNEDKKVTEVYKLEYCTNRSIRAMGFDVRLSDLQERALLPLPSDVSQTNCKVPVPASSFYSEIAKRQSVMDEYNEEKFSQTVSGKSIRNVSKEFVRTY